MSDSKQSQRTERKPLLNRRFNEAEHQIVRQQEGAPFPFQPPITEEQKRKTGEGQKADERQESTKEG